VPSAAHSPAKPSRSATIETVNPRHQNDPPLARQHAGRGLRDVESVLLERYRPTLLGDVLELIPGGSRLTEELVHQARSYTGIGPSAAVIGVCRHLYRGGSFVHADIRELGRFGGGAFSAVVAWRCAIDPFEDAQRRVLLERVGRVLRHDGVLVFSSHNLAGQTPTPQADRRAGRLGGLLRGRRPRSSRAPMDDRELGYALLSGIDDDLPGGQYHIERDRQETQLGELGFRLVECLDLAGQPVGPEDDAAHSPELHYVAQPAGSPPVAM
jgi:SAM-dependent methyltransferase